MSPITTEFLETPMQSGLTIAELAAAILKSTAAARVYEGPSIHERVPKILSERGLGVPKNL